MSNFVISGPSHLSGEIEVFGAKNAAMKMIAASVLIAGEVTLENVPDIADVQIIIDILAKGGAKISRSGHTLTIDTAELTDADPDPNLVKKMRGSIVLIGPYLARFGKIKIPQPGGCVIGARPIDIHLDIFRQLGCEISQSDDFYEIKTASTSEVEEPVKDTKNIRLKNISVTATENALMAVVKGAGRYTLENVAQEPEIADLAEFLNRSGAKISGAGSEKISVEAVSNLKGINYHVMPDRIEAGTFCSLAAATKSPLKIIHCQPRHLEAFLAKLSEIGVVFETGQDYIQIQNCDNLKATNIETAAYPGFATDLQAPMGLLLTQAQGQSNINETVFEKRLGYLDELKEMGADVKIIDDHHAAINGPTPLSGRRIESLDLRAGATMILAGLAARGETTITDAEIVDRGYEKIEQRLQKLGAKIERTL